MKKRLQLCRELVLRSLDVIQLVELFQVAAQKTTSLIGARKLRLIEIVLSLKESSISPLLAVDLADQFESLTKKAPVKQARKKPRSNQA